MFKIVEFSHLLIKSFYERYELTNPIFIDATCGMGNDTLFMATLLNNNGSIIAYDIQIDAINQTRHLLENTPYSNINIKHDSHENINETNINLAIYNLGYLPGYNKNITTLASSTLKSIKKVLENVANEFLIVIVVYPGHEQGKQESIIIDEFCYTLSSREYLVSKYQNYNRPTAPYILTISKNILK